MGISGLLNGDRRPKNKRQSAIDEDVEKFILGYRKEYGNIDKDEIKPHLDEFCKEKGIKSISISSIGGVIKKLKEGRKLSNGVKYSLNGKSGNLNEQKTKAKAKQLNAFLELSA